MSDLDDFLSHTIDRQIEAEKALIAGDQAARMAMWSRTDPITLFSAGGECLSGWPAVNAFFELLGRRFSSGANFRFDLEAVELSGDLAYTVGFERFEASIAGAPVRPITIRTTHVYRREDGQWKIVHRHGDGSTSEDTFSR